MTGDVATSVAADAEATHELTFTPGQSRITSCCRMSASPPPPATKWTESDPILIPQGAHGHTMKTLAGSI